MKRREIIKTGLLAAGVAAIGLTGCNKKTSDNLNLEVKPKQTGTYEFSVPLPFDFKVIDEIAKLNSKLKKSKVTCFYGNMPRPLASDFDQWFQLQRGENENVKTFDDFKKYVNYAKRKGFKISYLLNSAKAFSAEDFNNLKDKFDKLMVFLKDLKVDDVKIGNTQVADILKSDYPYFKFSWASTFEFHNMSQYNNIYYNHPNVDSINLAIDENQNFSLLKALKKAYPDIKPELTVNEVCIKGCPARMSHGQEPDFCVYDCGNIEKTLGVLNYFSRLSIIYPWQLPYYSSIGVNNFKFLADDPYHKRANYNDITSLKNYLSYVENGVENVLANEFFNGVFPAVKNIKFKENVKLNDIKKYLPDITYFVKNGDVCAINCQITCNYCGECVKNIEPFIEV